MSICEIQLEEEKKEKQREISMQTNDMYSILDDSADYFTPAMQFTPLEDAFYNNGVPN